MPTRPRNAEATRAEILRSSRSLFAASGFDGVSLRDIATKAGINVALVVRYFGSKDQLFAEAVSEGFVLSDLVAVPRDQLGEVLSRYILSKAEHGRLEPLQALLRSSSNLGATALMQNLLEQEFIAPLSAFLYGENTQIRAGLIASLILGVATARDVLSSQTLQNTDLEILVARLAPMFQSLIDA
jgi:AcrR family transcriptional regulator